MKRIRLIWKEMGFAGFVCEKKRWKKVKSMKLDTAIG